jgi:hypothetical protein
MEAAPSNFRFLADLESLSDWADELKPIPSTTLTSHRRVLVTFSARLGRLLETGPENTQKTTPVRKSARVSQKQVRPEVRDQESPPLISAPLKAGDIFINAVKVSVHVLFVRFDNDEAIPSVIAVLL